MGSQEDISNLGAGVYSVLITDVNGCQLFSSFEPFEIDMEEPEEFEIFIACLPGLERELLSEIKKNGFKQAKLMVGGVSLFGDWRDVWRANFYLRGATKVLVRFASFRVTHLAQLDKLSHLSLIHI